MAAGLISAAYLQGNPLANQIHTDGSNSDHAFITFAPQGSGGTNVIVTVDHKDTTSLLFNSGDHWWPNAVIQGAIQETLVSKDNLAAGTSADVWSWLGMSTETHDHMTSGLMYGPLSYDASLVAVSVWTNSSAGPLKANHAYSFVGNQGRLIKLHDPCDAIGNYEFEDIKGQINTVEVGNMA